MRYSLGLSKNGRDDYSEIIRNAHGRDRPMLRRAYRELIADISEDGPDKGISASFNSNWKRLEDETGSLAVVFDIARAADDRYIRVLHFVRVTQDVDD